VREIQGAVSEIAQDDFELPRVKAFADRLAQVTA
jgi:hypothetical protein